MEYTAKQEINILFNTAPMFIFSEQMHTIAKRSFSYKRQYVKLLLFDIEKIKTADTAELGTDKTSKKYLRQWEENK